MRNARRCPGSRLALGVVVALALGAWACLAAGCAARGGAEREPAAAEPGSFARRLAEAKARHGMVPGLGPFRYVCGDAAAGAITVTFYATEPPALLAERAGETVVLFQEVSGSGARYADSGREFWEHHGEALVTWGSGAPQERCIKTP